MLDTRHRKAEQKRAANLLMTAGGSGALEWDSDVGNRAGRLAADEGELIGDVR
jgi:hypothetical protein